MISQNCPQIYSINYPQNYPQWTTRDHHILRNELKANGILKHIREGTEHNLICVLCNLDIGKKIIVHMKTKHSEILEETIRSLVVKGLLDDKFLNMHFDMKRGIESPY